MYRTVKQEHLRRAVGIDNVDITPADEDGNVGAAVVVNLFSGLTSLYPYRVIKSENTAIAIIQYVADYGMVDEIHSDPGKDYTSHLVADLNKYLGMQHVFSLVNRHQSNGVERVIQEVLRHLRAIVYEERLVSKWSSPRVLPLLKYILNSSPLSERGGYTAYQLTYGTKDQSYYVLRKVADGSTNWPMLVKELDNNLKEVREASLKYQKKLIEERTQSNNLPANLYQPGDFISRLTTGMRVSKLTPRYRGPYEVVRQVKNDIECKHLAGGATEFLHVEDVQLFIGSRTQALEAANWDADQFKVDIIKAHRGDVWHRTTMEFLVVFSDGEEMWQRFNTDNHNISKTIIFEEYCRAKPELYILVLSDKEARKYKSTMDAKRITSLHPGDIFYLDLRVYGWQWYAELNLPNLYSLTYVTECRAMSFSSKESKIYIKDISLDGKVFYFKNYDVCAHCYRRNLVKGEIIIDNDFITRFPQVKKD